MSTSLFSASNIKITSEYMLDFNYRGFQRKTFFSSSFCCNHVKMTLWEPSQPYSLLRLASTTLRLFTADKRAVVLDWWCRRGSGCGCGWDRSRRPRQPHMRSGRGARGARAAAPIRGSGGHGRPRAFRPSFVRSLFVPRYVCGPDRCQSLHGRHSRQSLSPPHISVGKAGISEG